MFRKGSSGWDVFFSVNINTLQHHLQEDLVVLPNSFNHIICLGLAIPAPALLTAPGNEILYWGGWMMRHFSTIKIHCFLLIEFHCISSISFKMLQHFVYDNYVFIRM